VRDLQWRVPLSCGGGRADVDREGAPCVVYDVVFNDGSLARANEVPLFLRPPTEGLG